VSTLIDRGPLRDPNWTAKRIGVKPETLATWRCQGRGPAFVKLGRKVSYFELDVLSYIAANRREPGVGSSAHI
jgi:hypothetical protein